MIYEQLLKFQQKGITIEKDGKNPHFGNTYSTLNEVLEKVTKPLNELGIVIVQGGVNENGIVGLKTALYHVESKTEVSCFMPYVGATDSQKLGGANTYLRRYSIITLLGLGDADDDGTVASAPAKKTTTNEPPF